MTKADELKVSRLIHKLGLKYKLLDDEVRKIVESQFEFTYNTINEIDFDSVITEKDLEKTKTNFNFKHIGKLFVNIRGINAYRKRKKLSEWKKLKT